MISPVVSSLVYSKKRRTIMEVFPPRLRKLWKEWDIRLLVLLSLTLQVVLIILGNRRKHNHKVWIRIVVWVAYLASDYVATCALGVLSNNLSDIYDDEAGCLDANIELTALWAPFLLLHLGGPDTITAYALEDNELWLRHLLGLVIQTAIAVYIFLMSWTGSHLSILFILMSLAGLVKYGERTWVLRSVSLTRSGSIDNSGESDYRDFGAENYEFSVEENVRINEGYIVVRDNCIEMRQPVDICVLEDNPISHENKLLSAYKFLNLTKCFVLDVLLSPTDNTRTFFGNISFEDAWEVIELELGMLYDLLYTKAPLLYTPWGLALRLITFFVTCSVLVLFTSLDLKLKYSKVDLLITFLLVIVGIILEIYAALILLFSDRFAIWLIMHKKISTFGALTSFLPFYYKRRKWSNSLAQYSFLSVSPLACHYILKPLTIFDHSVEKRWHIQFTEVPEKLKDLIFCCLRRKAYDSDFSYKQDPSLLRASPDIPNFEEELGKSILFWHIVTEVLYYLDDDDNDDDDGDGGGGGGGGGDDDNDDDQQQSNGNIFAQSSQEISRYMLYLLVVHPSILSVGINQINFQETLINQASDILRTQWSASESQACKRLIQWYRKTKLQEDEQSRKSFLYRAVRFAAETRELRKNWEEICEVWLGILRHAASTSKGNPHAQGLRTGGELLTHVWLLAAHLGLTTHFPNKSPLTRLYAV